MRGSTKAWRMWTWCALVLACQSCASWRPVAKRDHWTLFARPNQMVDADAYAGILDPAVEVVERELGPFRGPVRVYAWEGDGELAEGAQARITGAEAGPAHAVPAVSQARLRGFHARSDGLFGPASGVYVGSREAGTAVHELVHARLTEIDSELPLWFEEGVACVLGDGYLDGENWIVDGLWCWPLRELADTPIQDADLARLLALRADEPVATTDNVLAHFIGWAIVFDMFRESDGFDWKAWHAQAHDNISLEEARVRIQRTLADATIDAWLTRLADPRREVRLATAKGLWKLQSRRVIEALITTLEREQDAEVRVALAINILAAAGEVRLSDRMTGRMWRSVWPTLKRATLEDATEQAAVQELLRSFRSRSSWRADKALDVLSRYWAE